MKNVKQPLSASRRARAGILSFVALTLVACADPAATPSDDVDEYAALSPERLTPRLVLAQELAVQGVAAVELWSAATRDAFVPDLSIGECGRSEDLCIRIVDEPPTGCGAQVRGAVACFRGSTIDVWQGVRDDWTVSVVAHELGHSLGLGHVREGLMSPDRDRTKPCIESDDIVALDDAMGVPGSPACVR